MTGTNDARGYHYEHAGHNCSHAYLLPAVLQALGGLAWRGERRVFDLGCGNGSVARTLTDRGYRVTGVDPSSLGIEQAKKAHPDLDLHLGSAYDDLAGRF